MSWEGGGGGINEFIDHLGNVEAKREEGAKEAILELKSLIRRHRINNKSPGKTKISGSLAGRVTKKR